MNAKIGTVPADAFDIALSEAVEIVRRVWPRMVVYDRQASADENLEKMLQYRFRELAHKESITLHQARAATDLAICLKATRYLPVPGTRGWTLFRWATEN